MLTLGIDSSAVAASAALVEDGKLLGEFYCNTKQVHSQTLLPMVEGLLQTVGRSCGELDHRRFPWAWLLYGGAHRRLLCKGNCLA